MLPRRAGVKIQRVTIAGSMHIEDVSPEEIKKRGVVEKQQKNCNE